jgi:hypothetical protein
MNELLESAVTAHGGLDRWNEITSITVDASITGAVWPVKGQADVMKLAGKRGGDSKSRSHRTSRVTRVSRYSASAPTVSFAVMTSPSMS